MATIETLAADVYTLTNRPDLEQETKVALRKALLKFHSADTFKRDLFTQRIQTALHTPLLPDEFRWVISLSEFPRFRRPKILHTPISGSVVIFKEVAADNLFDAYSGERQNYFFIAGSAITIRSQTAQPYLDFTYYRYPLVPPLSSTAAPIDSWIAEQFPDAIVEEAAGAVFKMIGKDEEFSRYQTLFQENLSLLRQTDLGEGV